MAVASPTCSGRGCTLRPSCAACGRRCSNMRRGASTSSTAAAVWSIGQLQLVKLCGKGTTQSHHSVQGEPSCVRQAPNFGVYRSLHLFVSRRHSTQSACCTCFSQLVPGIVGCRTANTGEGCVSMRGAHRAPTRAVKVLSCAAHILCCLSSSFLQLLQSSL